MRRGVVTGSSHRRPLQWEPVNFRGVDMSIADITVTGDIVQIFLFIFLVY